MKTIFNAFIASTLLLAGAVCAQGSPGIRVDGNKVLIRQLSDDALELIAQAANKSQLEFIFDDTITQEDFDSVLRRFPWVTAVSTVIWNPHIWNVNAASKLPELRSLKLESLKKAKETRLDLSPLAKLTRLEKLDLKGTPVTNVKALAGLVNLEELNLYMADVDSLDSLSGMSKLRKLSLYGFGHTFKDYAPLAGLANLEDIDLYMNKQANDANLAVLRSLRKLKRVHISFTSGITNLGFLENSKGLRRLDAWQSKDLVDISGLADARELEVLNINETMVGSLEPMRGKESLLSVAVEGTRIVDLSPLASARSLESLNIKGTGVKDLSPLFGCRNFVDLEVDRSFPAAEIEKLKTRLPGVRLRPY